MSAIDNFVSVFSDPYTISDLAGALSCSEAEAFSALYREAGDSVTADQWLTDHALHDDAGDDPHLLSDGTPAPVGEN